MREGVRLSSELPEWVKLSIANAVVVFGRIEQEAIEISWLLTDATLKARLKLARTPASENFLAIIESAERSQDGLNLDALKDSFVTLANERNLIVHGAWTMTDDKPWVVWHKFVEDTDSIIGEHFEAWRFERSMKKANHILGMLHEMHNSLEAQTGTKTSAIPRA